MIISINNISAFNNLYFHDNVFLGFCYDYDKRTVSMVCSDPNLKKQKCINFNNVIALQMQSCEFWGEENRIYDIWVDEEPVYYSELVRIQNENKEKYAFSRLDDGTSYISIEIQLISGDEIKISFETVEISEIDA